MVDETEPGRLDPIEDADVDVVAAPVDEEDDVAEDDEATMLERREDALRIDEDEAVECAEEEVGESGGPGSDRFAAAAEIGGDDVVSGCGGDDVLDPGRGDDRERYWVLDVDDKA